LINEKKRRNDINRAAVSLKETNKIIIAQGRRVGRDRRWPRGGKGNSKLGKSRREYTKKKEVPHGQATDEQKGILI